MTLLLKISLLALMLPLVLGGTCPDYWTSFNGHCYKFFPTYVGWSTAKRRCEQNGAYLVSINSGAENNFVSYLSSCSSEGAKGYITWIGLGPDYHSQNPPTWLDGTVMTYTRWYPGEPNNSGGNEGCIETNFNQRGEWNDAPCNVELQFMCERSQQNSQGSD